MSLPGWWENEKSTQNNRSKKQEKKRAIQTGGKTQSGSGSSWRSPSDVITGKDADGRLWQEELKYTDKSSYSLKISDWRKLEEASNRSGREPRFVIDFPSENLRLIVTGEEIE